MNPQRTFAILGALFGATAALSACDTAPSTTASGGASSSTSDGSTASVTSSDASSGVTSTDASSGDASSSVGPGSASSSGSGGPITACSDIGAMECFSNYDCPSMADRCENQGTPDEQVPCCAPGARGTGLAGDACTGENDCKSSLCFEIGSTSFCSDICMSDNECPDPPFDGCGPIAFSGSNDDFCLP